MMKFLVMLAVVLASFAATASAQSCGGVYYVERGDSLSYIADRLYKDALKWTALHQANLDTIGADPNKILVGQRLYVSCINGRPVGLEPIVALSDPQPEAKEDFSKVVLLAAQPKLNRKIKLVTEDNFAPFTGRALKNGGMIAEVVEAALTSSVGALGFEFHWINDPATHLDPLLTENVMDMSMAWAKPDCAAIPFDKLCTDFLYSAPAFEYLVLLFFDKSRPLPFTSDADMEGRTLCRPDGYLTHMLDQDGRNWLKDGKIILKRGKKVDDCFDMVLRGEADAVVINEFTGRATIRRMGIKGRIDVGQGKPLSITSLHVVMSKNNPNALALLHAIDTGLSKIRENGRFQTIINDHLTRIWAGF